MKFPNIFGSYGQDPRDFGAEFPDSEDDNGGEDTKAAQDFLRAREEERRLALYSYDSIYRADARFLERIKNLELPEFMSKLEERFKGEELPLALLRIVVLAGTLYGEYEEVIKNVGSGNNVSGGKGEDDFGAIMPPRSDAEADLFLSNFCVGIKHEFRVDLLRLVNTAGFYARRYFRDSARNLAYEFAERGVRRSILGPVIDLEAGSKVGVSLYRGEVKHIIRELSVGDYSNLRELRDRLSNIIRNLIQQEPQRASLQAVDKLVRALDGLSKELGGYNSVVNQPVDMLRVYQVLNCLDDFETPRQLGIHPGYFYTLFSKVWKKQHLN